MKYDSMHQIQTNFFWKEKFLFIKHLWCCSPSPLLGETIWPLVQGCRDSHGPGPLTFIYHKLSVNIHHNYVNMNECTFEAQFYMHEYSFIMIKWNWQTLSEFPGCVCMKKQRFWLSLFTVCLNLKELWNIRTFTCLTFNRKMLFFIKTSSQLHVTVCWVHAHVLKHTQRRRLCFPFQNLDLLFPSNSGYHQKAAMPSCANWHCFWKCNHPALKPSDPVCKVKLKCSKYVIFESENRFVHFHGRVLEPCQTAEWIWSRWIDRNLYQERVLEE